jgi:hypothetical protein
MSKFEKPKIAAVYEVLRKHDSLIVHFSGPKGDEVRKERFFPADLRNVIAGRAAGGVSCSTISSHDNFNEYSWGSIGVVIGFTNQDSLVGADPHDCGSREEIIDGKTIRVVPNERDLSVTDLEATITQRKSYNEWVVRDPLVLGVFAHPPLIAWESADVSRYFTREELTGLFTEHRIFSFKDGLIYRIVPGPIIPIQHTEIYQAPVCLRG